MLIKILSRPQEVGGPSLVDPRSRIGPRKILSFVPGLLDKRAIGFFSLYKGARSVHLLFLWYVFWFLKSQGLVDTTKTRLSSWASRSWALDKTSSMLHLRSPTSISDKRVDSRSIEGFYIFITRNSHHWTRRPAHSLFFLNLYITPITYQYKHSQVGSPQVPHRLFMVSSIEHLQVRPSYLILSRLLDWRFFLISQARDLLFHFGQKVEKKKKVGVS